MSSPLTASTPDEAAVPLLVRADESVTGFPPAYSPTSSPPSAPLSPLVLFWRKLGGGSLTLSLAIHAGLLFAAGFLVIVVQMPKAAVDFLPGGSTSQGKKASQDRQHQVQQKKRTQLQKAVPKQKLVSTSITSAVTLPEAPTDLLDLPDATQMLGSGGGMGGAGLSMAGSGAGAGFGTAFGNGAVKGFTGMTFFGKLGGEGMPGTFYDLKQTAQREPTGYADSEAAYAEIINRSASRKFAATTMKDYYKASRQMSFTFLAIPNMSANEGPKSFSVENEVEPRAWFVHYTSTITAPSDGDYRFVGFFDDALLVYINNKIVLDASWYAIHGYGEKNRDTEIRQDFGGPSIGGNRHAYLGKWFKFKGVTKIDIVVGERPGGRVGGLLLIEQRKAKYTKRPDGTPILPVFAMSPPDLADADRLSQFKNGDIPFEIASETPVFKISKSPFDD